MPKGKRSRPQHLPDKLLAIRKQLGASQSELAKMLGLKVSHARISEYENGKREPSLLALLGYAKLAGVSVDVLIDDQLPLH